MIQIDEEVLLTAAEQDRIWNCVHSMWGRSWLQQSSGLFMGCAGLMNAAGVHSVNPRLSAFLDELRNFATLIIEDDSWIVFAEWTDEEDSAMSVVEIHEVESVQELARDFRDRVARIETALEA